MILTFPTPYPDELLYSVLARYHVRMGNISPKRTIEEIYGKRTIRSVLDLPCNLQLLEKRLNNRHLTSDFFIYNNTLFPYYNAFFFA